MGATSRIKMNKKERLPQQQNSWLMKVQFSGAEVDKQNQRQVIGASTPKVGIKLLSDCHMSAARMDRNQLSCPTNIISVRKPQARPTPAQPKVAQNASPHYGLSSGCSTCFFDLLRAPKIKTIEIKYMIALGFQFFSKFVKVRAGPVSSAEFLFLRK